MYETPDKFGLITRNVEEIVTKIDLNRILDREFLKGYIGVEPSGLFHIGWLIWAEKLRDLMIAGIEMNFLEATWHAWLNDKLDGKMENIRVCAVYLEQCLVAIGVDTEKLHFIKSDEMIDSYEYWTIVLKVAKKLSLARVKRALTIMGRNMLEGNMDFSKLLYPAMQVADMFYLDVDLCLGGTDQRKAHILAREVANKLNYKKPVAIHTPILIGLGGLGRMDVNKFTEVNLINGKMSKSKPETCIFIHDSEHTVEKKILNAFCPPRQIEHNPIIDFNRHILFTKEEFALEINRPKKFGDDIRIESLQELLKLYSLGKIHPLDLKRATAIAINEKLEPIQRHFASNTRANKLYLQMRELVSDR